MITGKKSRRLPETGRSIGGGVAGILRASIINGELVPGERLGQDELCEDFGVSQAPVREALRKLEAEGLVEHRPNRGVFVLGLERDELLNVVAPVRVLLECHALERALENDPDGLIGGLTRIVEEMTKASAAGDLDTVNDLDVAFHELPVRMSELPHTNQLWRSVMPRLRAEFTRLAPAHDVMEDIVDEHRQLLEAVRTRDPALIREAVHLHAVVATKELLDRVPAAQAAG